MKKNISKANKSVGIANLSRIGYGAISANESQGIAGKLSQINIGVQAMTAKTPVLTDSKTENLPIHAQGKCEQRNIFEILIRAATQRDRCQLLSEANMEVLNN